MLSGPTLAPLRVRDFRWFFASQSINRVGGAMAPVALAFAVLDISRAPWALGVVLAGRTIPLVLFLLVGGVISDRLSRSAVLRWGNLLAGITQAVAATLVITGRAEIWTLVVLEVLQGLLSAVTFPAMTSVVPQLVPAEQLRPANLLLNLVRGLIQVIGPTIAALLVVGVGPGWALAVDAATWLLSAALMLPIRIPAVATATTSALADLREGWVLFRRTQWLWVVVVAFGLMNMVQAGAVNTLGPVLSETTFGAAGFGLLLSSWSAGDLLGTLALTRVHFSRPLFAGMLGMLFLGVQITCLGLFPDLRSQLPLGLLAGVGLAVFGLAWTMAMQEHIAPDLLARASSYDAVGSFAAIPVGQLLFGQLGHVFGVREVITAGGIGYLVVTLLALCSRDVRRLGSPTSR